MKKSTPKLKMSYACNVLCLPIISFLSLVACSSTHNQPKTLTSQAPSNVSVEKKAPVEPFSEIVIGQGDKIAVSIFGQETVDSKVTVMQDGFIMLPLIGDVAVDGRSIKQLREELADRYSEYFKKPQVIISIESVSSKRYAIVGEVGTTGVFPLTRETTVSDALFAAGGISSNGKPDRVVLVRKTVEGTDFKELNIEAIYKKGDFSNDVALQHGDIIYVPTKKLASAANFMQMISSILSPIYGLEKAIVIWPDMIDALGGDQTARGVSLE